jgi:hypothetical protein
MRIQTVALHTTTRREVRSERISATFMAFSVGDLVVVEGIVFSVTVWESCPVSLLDVVGELELGPRSTSTAAENRKVEVGDGLSGGLGSCTLDCKHDATITLYNSLPIALALFFLLERSIASV